MNIRGINSIKPIVLTLVLISIVLTTGSGVKRDIPVLLYHAVSDEVAGTEELFVKPSEFYKQIKYLADNGYTPLDFYDLKDYTKFKKPVMITFDDGYMDNYDNAYPILKKFNFKATIFMIASLINTHGYLTERQMKEMSDLISFQSHTLDHPELDKIKEGNLENEFEKSKQIIERITLKPINAISYPFGRYNKTVVDKVSSYYKYAVTTKTGFFEPDINMYEINRIGIMRSCGISDFMKKLKNIPCTS